MSLRSNIGVVRPGDVVLMQRSVFADQTIDIPVGITGATLQVSILDGTGDMVTSTSALVNSVTDMNLPPSGGITGYTIEFQVSIPDVLDGAPEGTPYTALLQFAVVGSSKSAALPTVQESFSVVSDSDALLGPLPCVVIPPYSATLQYTFASQPITQTPIQLVMYYGNTVVSDFGDISSKSTWNGNTLGFEVDTSQFSPSLMPYALLWNLGATQEIAPFFVINPSIHLAMKELHDFVNKNCSDWNTRELTFTPDQLIAALYNGACLFNSEGSVTAFTMTNALGQIRAYWLQYSAVWLLQSQVLNGIETDFSYTNSSVTLDVDRASKYQSFADSLESSLRERVRPLKAVLTKRGNAQGDGSVNPLSFAPGAMGHVSLSLSPVSKVGQMYNPLSWRSALLSGGLNINDF